MPRTSSPLQNASHRPAVRTAGPDGPPSRRLIDSWGRQAAWVFAAYVVVHNGAAFLVNDWEGWSNFMGNVIVVTVWGLALVGLTFGVLVRWGLKDSSRGRNRAAVASLVAGVASVLAYAIFFMWAPFVVGPAALVLAAVGLRTAHDTDRGGRRYALVGGVLGALTSAYWLFCIAFALKTGYLPVPGSQ